MPEYLTPPFLRTVGMIALVALACEVILLPRLVGLDGALWRAVLYWRGCRADKAVDWIVDSTTWAAAMLLVAAALMRVRHDGVRVVWPPLALCLLGLLGGKLLKNVFDRARPSMLPGPFAGHSFPSGHVMNTALAALAIVVLAATFRRPHRWRLLALAMVATIFVGRLMLAHHWFLDAVGAVLAALALNGLALPAVRRRPVLAPAVLTMAFTAALATVLAAPRLRVRLPSPLSAPEHGPEVRPASALGTDALLGAWDTVTGHFRHGGYVWMRGDATIVLAAPDEGGDPGDPRRFPARAEASLAVAGQPDKHERRCPVLRITVNGRALTPFVPYFGWREYRLLLPPGTLRAGRNEVRLELTDPGGHASRFAVAYVRLDLGGYDADRDHRSDGLHR